MHYNEGWADGFEFGREYWEIWNEPDNRKMWTGTHEQFFELYKVTANHLKQRFGDSIKIGGCAFSGFYMLNRKDAGEWFKTLVPYIHEFLKYITSDENKARSQSGRIQKAHVETPISSFAAALWQSADKRSRQGCRCYRFQYRRASVLSFF